MNPNAVPENKQLMAEILEDAYAEPELNIWTSIDIETQIKCNDWKDKPTAKKIAFEQRKWVEFEDYTKLKAELADSIPKAKVLLFIEWVEKKYGDNYLEISWRKFAELLKQKVLGCPKKEIEDFGELLCKGKEKAQ